MGCTITERGSNSIQSGYILVIIMEISLQAIDDLDGRTIINPTELRTNRHYVVYYNFVTKTLLTELFPYVSLIFFNVCIFREIRRSVEIQKAMRCTQSQKEEIKSANVVVSQFTVFENYSKSRIFSILALFTNFCLVTLFYRKYQIFKID